jgi:thioredoxin-dependent peroxiredoxin
VLSVGDKVKSTLVQGTLGPVDLSAWGGTKLVLFFYPRNNTPGCTSENEQFRDNFSAFKKADCSILGCSRDTLISHQKFRQKLALPFDLLSDTDEHLCDEFGVIKEKLMYGKKVKGIERSTFLLDKDGLLVHQWRAVRTVSHVQEVLDHLHSLG